MSEQDKPISPADTKSAQQPLPSVRGSGDVLGGYRAPGDAKHHQPSPPHEGQGRPDARVEQALDHDPNYGKWGGKEAATPTHAEPAAPTTEPEAAPPAGGKPDQSPPPGHYGDGEMGGQGGTEPRP